MKKLFFLFILGTGCHALQGQSDSIKKIRFSGFKAAPYLLMHTGYSHLSLQQYQAFIKNDPYLYHDLSAYEPSSFEGVNTAGGLSLRAYADLPSTGKNGRELSIGIVFGGANGTWLSYSKREISVVDKYVGQVQKDTLLQVREKSSYYSFSVGGSQFFIPLGYHMTTSKKKYLWFTAGLEIAPGFSKYYYLSNKTESTMEGVVKQGTPESEYYRYYDYSSRTYNVLENSYMERLSGTGFVFFAGVPLSANIRFSKKVKVLRNINLHGQLTPMFVYSRSKYIPGTAGYGVNTELGLRFGW